MTSDKEQKNQDLITVGVVEDSRDLRRGVNLILESSTSCRCVGTFSSAEDFLERFPVLKPKVVLMDIGLPGISGIEATRTVKQRYPATEIIILSVFEDDDNVFQAICAGASGYVTKPVMPQRLLEAVGEVSAGGTPMSPHIARRVLNLFKQHLPPPASDYDLTAREKEVLGFLVNGGTFQDIADTLVVSVFTVRAHIRNIYEKLHVHSKSEAVAKALLERLI